jgi:hypothetical protein
MPPSDFLPRFIAIRLGVLAAILYGLRALAPDPGPIPAWPGTEPVTPAAASGRCERATPAEGRDSQADARLRDMMLHD